MFLQYLDGTVAGRKYLRSFCLFLSGQVEGDRYPFDPLNDDEAEEFLL